MSSKFFKSLKALGEGTVAFVAVHCGPNPTRLTVFFKKLNYCKLFRPDLQLALIQAKKRWMNNGIMVSPY